MLDENEGTVAEKDLAYAYNRQPLYKRVLVVIAGPLSNFIFAALLYWLLFIIGFTSLAPIIGDITPHSIAANAGLKPQQEIIQFDHKTINSWSDMIVRLLPRMGDKNTLQITTQTLNHTISEHTLNLHDWEMDNLKPDPLKSLGIVPYMPVIPAKIGTILANSPAAIAGLKKNDVILSINHQKIDDWQDLTVIIANHAGETLPFQIQRQGKKIALLVTLGEKRFLFFKKSSYLGISPEFTWPKSLVRTIQYPPGQALKRALDETFTYIHLNWVIMQKMVTGKISLQSLGGPITIFESAGHSFIQGIIPFLSFIAFLSIAIGFINILPIPGLDGGHFFFQMIELVFRKPLAEKWQLLFFRIGILLLLALFIQALVNDFMRLG